MSYIINGKGLFLEVKVREEEMMKHNMLVKGFELKGECCGSDLFTFEQKEEFSLGHFRFR